MAVRLGLTVLVCILVLVGCGRDGDHDHPQLKTGEQFYNHHCASCHQRSGDGAFLRGIPPVKYTEMKIHEIVDHVLGHGRGEDTRMPQFSDMPRHEAQRIAVYLRLELRAR
jgi:mono/diheme cytochrome c family protein